MHIANFFAAVFLSVAIVSGAQAAVVINSVNQTYSVFANDGSGFPEGGGGANPLLPLENFNQTATQGNASASISQTVTGYSGPAAIGVSAPGLSLQDSVTASANLLSTASTNLTLNFTLNFGQTSVYTRTAPNITDTKLLFQGLNNTSEIAPGTTFLGAGTYILQVRSSLAGTNTVNLQIIPDDPLPEPGGLSVIMAGFLLASRRRRH